MCAFIKLCSNYKYHNICLLVNNMCTSGPCLNGASCTNLPDDFDCTCMSGYAGKTCQDCKYSVLKCSCYRVWVMVFNATFSNISIISWRSALLVEESRVPSTCRKSMANFIT